MTAPTVDDVRTEQAIPPSGRWYGTTKVAGRFHLLTPSPFWHENDYMAAGEIFPVWYEGRVAACSTRETHVLREGGPFDGEFVRRQMAPWRSHNWRIDVFDTPQVAPGLHAPPESWPTWGGGVAKPCGHCLRWFEKVKAGADWPDRRVYSAWRRRPERGMFRLDLRGDEAQQAHAERWNNEDAPLSGGDA